MVDRLQQLIDFHTNSPEDAFILFALAKEYERREQFDKALSYYQINLSKNPDYVGTYYHAGVLYQKEGHQQKAIDCIQKGIEIATLQGDNHTRSELGMLLMEWED